MPLTSAADVIAVGGLDDADAYRLFRLADTAALTARINAEIPIAEAYIAVVAPTAYASVDANTLLLLGRACSYLVLQQLVETLKARKIEGSQWPLDQETSDRFENLVDVEYARQAGRILDLFGASESTTALCLPTFSVGNALPSLGDTRRRLSEQILAEDLAEAIDLQVPFVGGIG